MGDLVSETTELEWLNLFCSSIQGKPDTKNNISCFRTLNYRPSFFNKFVIMIEKEGLESPIEITPDVILWNNKKQIVLIIEVKGENSIEQDHLDQINKYKKIPLTEVQTRLRNIIEDPSITIKDVYTGIVYRNETISNCNLSEECQQLLENFMKDHMVLTQSHGNKLRILNEEYVNFDDNLKYVLIDGINLPINPLRVFYLTKKPCLKGVIWGIVNYIHDCFYNSEEIDSFEIEPLNLKRDVFFYSDVPIKRLIKALENLSRLKMCNREERNYIFRFNDFQDFEEIHNKINDIDCSQQKPIQSDLINYFR